MINILLNIKFFLNFKIYQLLLKKFKKIKYIKQL